jgi:hypothetical protein
MLETPSYLAVQGQAAGLIPPGSTTFHLLLAVHIAAALTCVATGAIAALSPKHPGRHPRLGTLYCRSLAVVVASAAWLAALHWPQDAYLLALGTLSLAAATLGRTARRRRWRWRRWRWIGLHLGGMSAFYVDNGEHLPLWHQPAAPDLMAAAQRRRAPPDRSCAGPPPRPDTASTHPTSTSLTR